MALYDKASLVLIPSGTKEGVIFSQKPTNGDGDFTFSRATAATRVNSDGLIEKETQNLLLQSNSFDTTWTNANITLTSGQSGYDGSNNAWKFESNAAGTTEILQSGLSTSLIKTHSVYAKAGSISTLKIYAGASKEFNLSAGTTSSSNSKITSVGGGWYRCEVFDIAQNFANIYITASAAGEYIYIQDAQVNYGLVATDYIETTTTAVYGGITDNVPRLDYTDSSCPALKLEPQRTNLVTQSEYIGGYINFGSVNTANEVTSPEGIVNATLIEGDGTQNQIYTATPDIIVPSAGSYTLSIFAKKGTEQYLRLFLDGFTGSSNNSAYFDLDNGTTPTTGASIDDYGNGWYRCYITATIDAGDLTGKLAFNVTESTSSVFYSNAGAANGKNIYIYGAQLEAGSYATSYIPTYGTSVTRNAESTEKTSISDLLGQTEGTLFLEASALSDDNTNRVISLSDGTSSNRVLLLYQATSNTIRGQFSVSGQSSIVIDGTFDTTQNRKMAFAYDNTSITLYVDGSEVNTISTGYTFTATLDDLKFDNIAGGNFFGNVKQLSLFKARLSNAELAELTTL